MNILTGVVAGIMAVGGVSKSYASVVIEAELANQIVAPFQINNNSTASGGKLVVKPSGKKGTGRVTYNLNITSPGKYVLSARVYAASSASNSLAVQLNAGVQTLWTLPVAEVWNTAKFNNELTLGSGAQTLHIYSREADVGLDKIELTLVSSTPSPSPTPSPTPTNAARGLWVWTTSEVLASATQTDQLIQLSAFSKVTDVYLFLTRAEYQTKAHLLRQLNSRLNAVGIRSWGLEGYRGYFSDSYGPQNLYDTVNALINFNTSATVNERFYGFHSDMEPQDGQGAEFKNTFHNGLTDSQLSTTGGGVWHATQALDREMLMRDWIKMHTDLSIRLRGVGLKYGAAMPSWTDDYYGQEVSATYNGARKGVMKHIMPLLDDYVVMSYNTNTTNAVNRVIGELKYADTLPLAQRPRVHAAVETHRGPGATVSYGDHATKNSRTAVLADIEILRSLLQVYSSFGGIDIHDWVGWRDIRP